MLGTAKSIYGEKTTDARPVTPFQAATNDLENAIERLRDRCEFLSVRLQPYMGAELTGTDGSDTKPLGSSSEALDTVHRMARKIEAIEAVVNNTLGRLVI
jgi:hypothetical protein